MVENKVIQIVFSNLKEYVKVEDINFFPSYGVLKYIFVISGYYFEITYDFVDAFYRIKLERVNNDGSRDIIFLTKSKRFQKDIKLALKRLNLSRKSFENHINAITMFIGDILARREGLNYFCETYVCDLKFDGIFI